MWGLRSNDNICFNLFSSVLAPFHFWSLSGLTSGWQDWSNCQESIPNPSDLYAFGLKMRTTGIGLIYVHPDEFPPLCFNLASLFFKVFTTYTQIPPLCSSSTPSSHRNVQIFFSLPHYLCPTSHKVFLTAIYWSHVSWCTIAQVVLYDPHPYCVTVS